MSPRIYFSALAQRRIEELETQNRDLLAALETFTINDLADERIRYGLLTQAPAAIARAKRQPPPPIPLRLSHVDGLRCVAGILQRFRPRPFCPTPCGQGSHGVFATTRCRLVRDTARPCRRTGSANRQWSAHGSLSIDSPLLLLLAQASRLRRQPLPHLVFG